MRKILSILFAALFMVGLVGATYTAITAVSSLDSDNDYAFAPAAWTTLATGGNINSVAFDDNYLLIIGVNVTKVGTSPTLNIMAGDNPPAFRAGIGNLSVSLTNNTVQWIGPLESARFVNSTGYVEMSGHNVTTGKVAVLKVAD